MTRIAPYVIAASALALSALAAAYWEQPRVLPLEQRRVAGREPPSEQRSEEQSGYWEVQLLHLHPHRAPTTATQPTDIPLTDIRATRDTRLLRSCGLWIPRLLGTARLPRLSGLWIPEPPALFSLLRFPLRISRGWLSRRSPFGALVA